MSHGKILQIGGPQELYDFPLNRQVGEFLGSMNEFAGTVENGGSVRIDLGLVVCAVPEGAAKEVIVAIRPEDICVSREPGRLQNEFPARLISRLFLGDTTVYDVLVNDKKLRGKTTRVDGQFDDGSTIYVRLPSEKLKIFPK
jgi:ABC-type Fe3+/spermidine/putrescine transport system ATPase subunit